MGPLIKSTAETAQTINDFTPPLWLNHKPIVMTPYAPFDGPYSAHTDAKYISIGHPQWREEGGEDELSAKVWRYSAKKWSRMSEELPLTRVADLCILMVKVLYQNHNTVLNPTVKIPSGTFENQQEPLELRKMSDFPKAFPHDLLKARLRRLRDELKSANLD